MENSGNEKHLIQQLFQNLGEVNPGQLVQLKDDLAKLAAIHQINLDCVDLETLRKLISLYMQNVMEDSAGQ